MAHELQFYIDGNWVDPLEGRRLDVIDPSTEEPFAQIALGGGRDVDRAVAAAKAAFPAFARTSRADRLALLRRILEAYTARMEEIATTVSREMGAPLKFARELQAPIAATHLRKMIETLGSFEFDTPKGTTMVTREPIGVCGMITPWNWPLNQIACKVGPAIAVGCAMVLKPSEIAPLNAVIFAEAMHEAGVPKGVFNLVHGDGPPPTRPLVALRRAQPSPRTRRHDQPRPRHRPGRACGGRRLCQGASGAGRRRGMDGRSARRAARGPSARPRSPIRSCGSARAIWTSTACATASASR